MNERPVRIELDLRGAATDGESRAFATQLLEHWKLEPPPFHVTLRGAGALGAPIPEAFQHSSTDDQGPQAILAFLPIWPWRSPAPIALFVGRGADRMPWWSPTVWRARRVDLILVPSRREKVELQTFRRFRRDRVWSLDAYEPRRALAIGLGWLASGTSGQNSPPPGEPDRVTI